MERRLAAILAADVVGYSRLLGADEAGTLETLRAHREELIEPKIIEHKGRIVKLMGDGLLAEFPSAVEAVECALEIQLALGERDAAVPENRRIIYRVGINIGDIVVEDDDIYGDGVNIAARLQALADPGGLCVSGKVIEEVRTRLDISYQDRGPQALKNIVEPVNVFSIDLASRAEATAGGPASAAMMARPAVAVLPFTNMSGDPEQEYFSDGLTEDIITALTHWRSFPVIARNSTFAYKNKHVDIKQTARELGARYLPRGQRSQGRSPHTYYGAAHRRC